jgi:glycerate dehydrogenase
VLTWSRRKDGQSTARTDLPNFILDSAHAWASREAMQALADQLIDNVEAFVAGSPRNLVT